MYAASSPAVSRQRIALVEAMDLTGVKSWEPKQDNYSNRVVSLTPGTMNFFSSKYIYKQAVMKV